MNTSDMTTTDGRTPGEPNGRFGEESRQTVVRDSLVMRKSILLPAIVLDILIIAECWDDNWRRWLAIGAVALHAVLNRVVYPACHRKGPDDRAARYREYGNAATQIAKVWIAHAAIPTWGWLIAFASMTDRKGMAYSPFVVGGLLAVQIGAGYYYAVPWTELVTLAALTVITMSVSIGRTATLMSFATTQQQQREELAQIQELAAQQEKMSSLGLLAAGIAHEINNPMAFVTSNISQLHRDLPSLPDSPDLQKEYLEEIIPEVREGIVRVNTIVDDLRRFARGDVETVSVFEVNDVIRSAVRMTHGRVAPGVSVALSLGEIPMQLGYARQLSQVVVNLLVNAIQAVSSGGKIRVRSGSGDTVFWFSIKDNGPGMDRETRTRIFEPFFTTKPPGEGTGLGLAVVHGIVEQLGGAIEVESEEGAGATFTVKMPLKNATQP
ncbi:MAG: HAMP domain-containing histidine kinase [Deltaproteobacteria bacterium]|nr:HAMP domain-containing histidine kinase [Deltaproteobacteria bacterium]